MQDPARRAAARHERRSMPSPSARRRTAGDASGFSPGSRRTAGGLARRCGAARQRRGRRRGDWRAVARGGRRRRRRRGRGAAARGRGAAPTLPSPSTSMPDQLGADRHLVAGLAAERDAPCPRPATASRRSPCRSSRRRAIWSSATGRRLRRATRRSRPRRCLRRCRAASRWYACRKVRHSRQRPSIDRVQHALNASPTRVGPGKYAHSWACGYGVSQPVDALDRRLEVVEAVLLHQRRQLGAEAAGARRLVHDHAAAGLLHRGDDRVEVERPEAAQVDDLGVDAGLARPRPPRHAHIVP